MRLCDLVLQYDAAFPAKVGEEDAPVEIAAETWARLVEQAKVDAERTKHYVAREAASTLDAMLRNPHELKPYDLGIIACSAKKLPGGPHAARDLYQGDLFKRSLAVAEQLCRSVCVLSAKYFVVGLSARLHSYDQRIESDPAWSGKTNAFLRHLTFEHGNRVLCLAPESYWKHLEHAAWEKPLKGLGIGRQKQRLASMLNERRAA